MSCLDDCFATTTMPQPTEITQFIFGQPLREEIKKKAADAVSRWKNIKNNWISYTNSKNFDDLLSDLQNFKEQYDRLPQKRL